MTRHLPIGIVAVLIALGLRTGHAQIQMADVYVSGFTTPVAFVADPTNTQVFFVVQQGGLIRTVRNRAIEPTPFLDLRTEISAGGERGLLGLAFAPDYATSGRFFVNFTNRDGNTVIGRFRRSANPLIADRNSGFALKWPGPGGTREGIIRQPYTNHNGGHLAFGPDGNLYIGMGDGGAGDDPEHRAQDPTTLLGKFLRVDVNVPDDHPNGYVVPADNPFLDNNPIPALPEIWSFGWRNPWKYTFDSPALGGTGALIVGDVGQAAFEEIDYEPAGRGGRNYGWRNREGFIANPNPLNGGNLPPAYLPLTDPIFAYPRDWGRSITGGYVYRGTALGPAFRGRYFFADFVLKRVWSIALTIGGSGEATASDVMEHTAALGGSAHIGNVSAFGMDGDGELYIVSYDRGLILSLVRVPGTPTGLRVIRQ